MADTTTTEMTPVKAFETVSGMEATSLLAMLIAIFILMLYAAFLWAIQQGYVKMTRSEGSILSFFKLLLRGIALTCFVFVFFIHPFI